MEHNPFVAPDVDPRAKAIEQARADMKVGAGATVSLAPAYEQLKKLTAWMAEHSYDAREVADAVANPDKYWEYMNASTLGRKDGD